MLLTTSPISLIPRDRYQAAISTSLGSFKKLCICCMFIAQNFGFLRRHWSNLWNLTLSPCSDAVPNLNFSISISSSACGRSIIHWCALLWKCWALIILKPISTTYWKYMWYCWTGVETKISSSKEARLSKLLSMYSQCFIENKLMITS